MSLSTRNKHRLRATETVVFAMLGALMFCSKIIMEQFPNIHLLGMFTMVFALVFRWKGLYPIYIFVLLTGLYGGFQLWWLPYLYIWTILFLLTMLLPQRMPRGCAAAVYPALCALHGLAFGILYAPAQALMFGLSFRQMLAWIAAGLPFDVAHGVGNFFAGLLVFPLSELLIRLKRRMYR